MTLRAAEAVFWSLFLLSIAVGIHWGFWAFVWAIAGSYLFLEVLREHGCLPTVDDA